MFPQTNIQLTPLADNNYTRYITIYLNERGRLSGYTGLTQNSTKFLEIDKAPWLYRNIRVCILEINPEGLRWKQTLCQFSILVIPTRRLLNCC